jgi:cell division protein FtsL
MVGKSRFTVVRMEKKIQFMIITLALIITIIIIIRQIMQINNKIIDK